MKALWRLTKYIRYYKREAMLSALMALVVALLRFAQIPMLIPIFKGLFRGSEDKNAMLVWPDKAVGLTLSLNDGVLRVLQWLQAHVLPGDEHRLALTLWSNEMAVRILPMKRGLLTGIIWMQDHPVKSVIIALGIIAVSSIAKGFAAFMQEYMAGKVHTGVTRHLAADLYHHVLGLSMSFHHKTGSASVASHFTNDIEAVRFGMSFFFNKVLVEPILLCGFLVMAALINWQLLLFNMAIFPPLAIGVRILGKKAKKATRKGLHSRDKLMSILQETFEGISIVKAYNMEGREEDRFGEENRNVRAHDLKVIKASAIASPFIEVMGILGVGLSMCYAAYLIDSKQMTLTEFAIFYAALVSISDPMRKLANLNTRLQSLIAASTRVFEVLDQKAEIVDSPRARPMPAFSDAICFNDVCFSYNGNDEVLKNVNVIARKGEIVALVGPSGAGKSTVARLIPRFYDVTSGAVTLDGADVREYTLSSVRDQIGLVTQDVILFNDTIAANIAYGRPGASQEDIEKAARAANAHEFILNLPNGYGSVIGEKGLSLSGGQRQRLALARAIIKDPPILILDEATSSLDSESEFLIQRALDEFMKDRTSIVIAHRLSTIEKASRIYVLAAGQVTAAGTNAELLDGSALYKNLYSRQFGLAEA